jgi:putative DNA primase/helicase
VSADPVANIRRLRRERHGRLSGDKPVAPAFSDEALALRLAEQNAGTLRYVAAWSRWLIWTGSHWQFDETLKALDLSRNVCRSAARECKKQTLRSVIASAKTVAAVERLAKADRRIAATVDQWDADPWQLNTPGGVVDLRDGEYRLQNPADYITKISGTAADPSQRIPHWLAFLDRVTGGDR